MPDNTLDLPMDYELYKRAGLNSNILNYLMLNVVGFLIFILLFLIGMVFGPRIFALDFISGLIGIISIALYIVTHMLIHGSLIKVFSGVRPYIKKELPLVFIGSNSYFNKGKYIKILLAPIILLGIILTIMLIFMPENWFWNIYTIWVLNIVLSVGDIYLVKQIRKMPKETFILDEGKEISFYVKNKD